MWNHTYTHRTSADPERLWRLLSDVDGWASWNDGIETINLHGPLAVGATFEMTPPGEEPITSTVVALDPPREISDNTEMNGLSITVEHILATDLDGATTIAFAITVRGDVPDEVAEEVGRAVSGDFPDVMSALAAAAQHER